MTKTVPVFLFIFLVALTGVPAVYAEDDSEAYDQVQETASDPSTFDGGSGSALNEDSGSDFASGVPDVGPSGPVGVATDQEGNNISY